MGFWSDVRDDGDKCPKCDGMLYASERVEVRQEIESYEKPYGDFLVTFVDVKCVCGEVTSIAYMAEAA